MKKQQKQMLILLLVLVLLGAGFWGLRKYNQSRSEEPMEEETITVVEFDDEEILRFTYDYLGESYTFEKENDVWYYAEDHSLNIKQSQIKTMISKIAPLTVEQVLENVSDKIQYGLAEPSGDTTGIQYETASESIILEVGNYNSLMNVYYICMPSSSTVYTVKGNVITGFGYGLEELVKEEEVEEATEENVDVNIE